MAKGENNKETGVEKAPVLTEDKGSDYKSETTEITPELVADLRGRIKDLEGYVPSLTTTIEGLEKKIETQKETIENRELVISNQEELLNEQKEQIVQLLIDKLELGEEKELPKEGEVVIRFLLSPAGRYKLPYNVGQEVALHKEVAAEIVEARYAEYVLEEE